MCSLSATTDVQSVSICRVEGTSTYSIQCGYVTGSTDAGCAYTVVGEGVLESGTIARGDSDGVTVELAGGTCCSEVLACDWETESENTTCAPPAVRVNISSSTEMCPTTTDGSFTSVPSKQ